MDWPARGDQAQRVAPWHNAVYVRVALFFNDVLRQLHVHGHGLVRPSAVHETAAHSALPQRGASVGASGVMWTEWLHARCDTRQTPYCKLQVQEQGRVRPRYQSGQGGAVTGVAWFSLAWFGPVML